MNLTKKFDSSGQKSGQNVKNVTLKFIKNKQKELQKEENQIFQKIFIQKKHQEIVKKLKSQFQNMILDFDLALRHTT